jgi:hypothetical protein
VVVTDELLTSYFWFGGRIMAVRRSNGLMVHVWSPHVSMTLSELEDGIRCVPLLPSVRNNNPDSQQQRQQRQQQQRQQQQQQQQQ